MKWDFSLSQMIGLTAKSVRLASRVDQERLSGDAALPKASNVAIPVPCLHRITIDNLVTDFYKTSIKHVTIDTSIK